MLRNFIRSSILGSGSTYESYSVKVLQAVLPSTCMQSSQYTANVLIQSGPGHSEAWAIWICILATVTHFACRRKMCSSNTCWQKYRGPSIGSTAFWFWFFFGYVFMILLCHQRRKEKYCSYLYSHFPLRKQKHTGTFSCSVVPQ